MDKESNSRKEPNKRKRHPLVSLVRVVILGYAVMLAALVLMESRMLFPGAYRNWNHDQRDASSPCVPFEYKTADGSMITGRRLDHAAAQHTVLYFHGNGIVAARLDGLATLISRHLKANVVLAEFRGFQNDAITPTESNLIEDSLAAHGAVCDHYGLQSNELIVYGSSLGGGCAAAVAEVKEPRILILDRTFDSAVNVAAARYPIFPVRLLMRNPFDSVSRLKNFSGKVIQFHGTIDRVIPIERAKALHQSIASTDKTFIELPNLGHMDGEPDSVMQQTAGLIGTH